MLAVKLRKRIEGLINEAFLAVLTYGAQSAIRFHDGHVCPERIVDEPLPRIQLEQGIDRSLGEVDEAFQILIPAEVLDRKADRVQPSLRGGLLQVCRGQVVLASGFQVGPREMNRARGEPTAEGLPPVDQPFMQ